MTCRSSPLETVKIRRSGGVGAPSARRKMLQFDLLGGSRPRQCSHVEHGGTAAAALTVRLRTTSPSITITIIRSSRRQGLRCWRASRASRRSLRPGFTVTSRRIRSGCPGRTRIHRRLFSTSQQMVPIFHARRPDDVRRACPFEQLQLSAAVIANTPSCSSASATSGSSGPSWCRRVHVGQADVDGFHSRAAVR